jgi:transcriptional regulator with XRE-family HTH domain
MSVLCDCYLGCCENVGWLSCEKSGEKLHNYRCLLLTNSYSCIKKQQTMNQPELGKRIAELRKAKELTQEELVEKCNLSVRTLQRIESGEVTPRSSTLNLIYAALDFKDEKQAKTSNEGKSNWLSLKTNKVAKIAVAISLLISVVLITAIGQQSDEPEIEPNGDDRLMVFRNYSSTITNSDREELFGYQVRFTCDSVYVVSKLFKVDKRTRKCKFGFGKGRLLPNKVELYRKKKYRNRPILNFSSKEFIEKGDSVFFKGDVVAADNGDTIKADEVVVIYQ